MGDFNDTIPEGRDAAPRVLCGDGGSRRGGPPGGLHDPDVWVVNAPNWDGQAPRDWATIYDVNPPYATGVAGSPLDGSGATIAIVGRAPIALSDVQAFRSMYGLPEANITEVEASTQNSVPNTGAAQVSPDDVQERNRCGMTESGTGFRAVVAAVSASCSRSLHIRRRRARWWVLCRARGKKTHRRRPNLQRRRRCGRCPTSRSPRTLPATVPRAQAAVASRPVETAPPWEGTAQVCSGSD